MMVEKIGEILKSVQKFVQSYIHGHSRGVNESKTDEDYNSLLHDFHQLPTYSISEKGDTNKWLKDDNELKNEILTTKFIQSICHENKDEEDKERHSRQRRK